MAERYDGTPGLTQALQALVAPELRLHGFELYDLQVLHGGGRLTLRFSIDKPGGVTIADCAAMDREISRVLEAEATEQLRGRYVVEVSSPGVFRRLVQPWHFERSVGETVRLKAREVAGSGAVIQLRGRLTRVEADALVVTDPDGVEHRIGRGDVESARLDPDLPVGRRDRAAERTRHGKGQRASRTRKGKR